MWYLMIQGNPKTGFSFRIAIFCLFPRFSFFFFFEEERQRIVLQRSEAAQITIIFFSSNFFILFDFFLYIKRKGGGIAKKKQTKQIYIFHFQTPKNFSFLFNKFHQIVRVRRHSRTRKGRKKGNEILRLINFATNDFFPPLPFYLVNSAVILRHLFKFYIIFHANNRKKIETTTV